MQRKKRLIIFKVEWVGRRTSKSHVMIALLQLKLSYIMTYLIFTQMHLFDIFHIFYFTICVINRNFQKKENRRRRLAVIVRDFARSFFAVRTLKVIFQLWHVRDYTVRVEKKHSKPKLLFVVTLPNIDRLSQTSFIDTLEIWIVYMWSLKMPSTLNASNINFRNPPFVQFVSSFV